MGNSEAKGCLLKHEHDDFSAKFDHVLRGANAVLAVDLTEVPVTRVSQVAVGWLRAAFEQSRIISTLSAAGAGHAAAPNRRSFWELVIRMIWLGDMLPVDRASAVDTMLNFERANEARTHQYLVDNGLPSHIDVDEMESFVLNHSDDGAVKSEAQKLAMAVRGSGTNLWTVYHLWREDSTWTHATGFLAGQYAPTTDDDRMGAGRPPSTDRHLEAHRLAAMVLVAAAGDILRGEGASSELASAPFVAYFKVD